MNFQSHRFLCFCAFVLLFMSNVGIAEETADWDDIRQFLFQDKTFRDGGKFFRLDIPARPPNGGDVTVNIISSYPQTEKQFVAKHYLVVDKNPSPVAGIFSVSPKNGNANIATRIRVNEYSHVRLISETGQGTLYHTSVFVKVSGGCSSPPMNSGGMDQLETGKMRLIQEDKMGSGQPQKFQLSIMHPNYSGFQTDQITSHFIPPHYVESVEVSNQQGDIVFVAKGDISFTVNPSFDFSYMPISKDDLLTVRVIDSKKKVYQSKWPLSPV